MGLHHHPAVGCCMPLLPCIHCDSPQATLLLQSASATHAVTALQPLEPSAENNNTPSRAICSEIRCLHSQQRHRDGPVLRHPPLPPTTPNTMTRSTASSALRHWLDQLVPEFLMAKCRGSPGSRWGPVMPISCLVQLLPGRHKWGTGLRFDSVLTLVRLAQPARSGVAREVPRTQVSAALFPQHAQLEKPIGSPKEACR